MTGPVVAAVIGQVLAEWADTGYWPPCEPDDPPWPETASDGRQSGAVS